MWLISKGLCLHVQSVTQADSPTFLTMLSSYIPGVADILAAMPPTYKDKGEANTALRTVRKFVSMLSKPAELESSCCRPKAARRSSRLLKLQISQSEQQ